MAPSDNPTDPRFSHVEAAIQAAHEAAKATGTATDADGDPVPWTPVLILATIPLRMEDGIDAEQKTLLAAGYGNGQQILNMLANYIDDLEPQMKVALISRLVTAGLH